MSPSLEADPVRTSGCGYAASKRSPSARAPTTVDALADGARWRAAVDEFATAHPRRIERRADYTALIETGEPARVAAAVAAGRFRPDPPTEARINRLGGRRKRVYLLSPRDELLQRVLNRALQERVADVVPASCHSFLPGRGAVSAFRSLLHEPGVDDLACVRLDVRDYFGSIDVHQLLATLPEPLARDDALVCLLEAFLLDGRVVRGGVVQEVPAGAKGVMAGTPLGPLLGDLALADLDADAEARGLRWARYSDDLLALCSGRDAAAVDAWLRGQLAARGLVPNEEKSAMVAAGDPWDFLGFRYHAGAVDLAPHTLRKLDARAARLGRRLDRWRRRSGASPVVVAGRFVRVLQRKLYGWDADRAAFSWAAWYFPVLSTDAGLSAGDHIVQRRLRWAATGLHTARGYRRLPYAALREVGYVPLVSAWWTWRRDPARLAREL